MQLDHLNDYGTFIVNLDGKMIHTKPAASESCNTDDAIHKQTMDGKQLKSGDYADFDFCEYCFLVAV